MQELNAFPNAAFFPTFSFELIYLSFFFFLNSKTLVFFTWFLKLDSTS